MFDFAGVFKNVSSNIMWIFIILTVCVIGGGILYLIINSKSKKDMLKMGIDPKAV